MNESIYDPNYLKEVTRSKDLIKRLNELHRGLSTLSQDVDVLPKGLKTTASYLVSNKILSHTDKDVRLLTSCCLVDIFRVYAPDAPFGNEEVISVFEVIIAQLRSLSTHDISSAVGVKIFYILNSLSTFQSCVLPVLLAQNNVANAAELILSLFDTLVSSIRSDHPEDVANHMASILQSCIEESDETDQDLLEILLTPLLPSARAENPAAFQLVSVVLRRVTNCIQVPVSTIINHILVGTMDSNREGACKSELADHVYSLIYELHKISPGLLLRVLPNVCSQLQAEEEDIRLKAVKLLGRLFASPHADYGTEFSRNFKEFLSRCNDVSPQIRLEMMECISLIIKRKAALITSIEDYMVKRLRDNESDVRLCALNKCIDAMLLYPESFSVESFKEVGGRAKDKKADIRKSATTGLAKIYYRYISSTLPSIESMLQSDASISDNVSTELASRLDFIPGLLLNCYSYPEINAKHMIFQLLQEYVLPKSSRNSPQSDEDSSSSHRASALIYMFSILEQSNVSMLGNIMSFKSKVGFEISSLSDARSKMSSTSADKNNNFKRSLHRLLQLVNPVDKKSPFIDKFTSVKDKNVFKLLAKATDPGIAIDSSCATREDLKQRLDSRSPFGEYVGMIYDMGSYMFVNVTMCQCILSYITQLLSKDPLQYAKQIDIATSALTLCAKYSPQVFVDSAEAMQVWLATSYELSKSDAGGSSKSKANSATSWGRDILQSCVRIINQTASILSKDKHITKLCSSLMTQSLNHTSPSVCEALAEAAAKVSINCHIQKDIGECKAVDGLMNSTTKSLSTKSLSHSNKRLASDMLVLASIAKIPYIPSVARELTSEVFANTYMKAILSYEAEVIHFITQKMSDSSDVNIVSAALRLWTNIVCSKEQLLQDKGSDNSSNGCIDDSTVQLSESLQSLVTAIFECISSKGCTTLSVDFKSQSDKNLLYETAASCAIHLLKLHVVGKGLTVEQWQSLGWTLLCDREQTRKRLLADLSTVTQTNIVHPRFLVYFCLLANDDMLAPSSQQSLMFSVRRLRTTHEELLSRALTSDSEDIQLQAEENMPENLFPYALYLLSYHPDFPVDPDIVSDSDKKGMKVLIKSVKMIIKVLLDSLSNQADNISFLFKQLHMISQDYEDCNDASNIGLHFITKLANKLLTNSIRTAENVQAYPGEVLLPMDLFKLYAAGKSNQPISRQRTMIKAGLEYADIVIDNAVQATKNNRKTTSDVVTMKRKDEGISRSTSASKQQEKRLKKRDENLPAEVPVRVSSRLGLAKASYVEPEESDRETDAWDAQAGEVSAKASKRTSRESVTTKSSKRNKFNVENDEGDEFSNDQDEELIKENAQETAAEFDIFSSQTSKSKATQNGSNVLSKKRTTKSSHTIDSYFDKSTAAAAKGKTIRA